MNDFDVDKEDFEMPPKVFCVADIHMVGYI